MSAIDKIKSGLIVSCQALVDEPLHGSEFMAKMALAAFEGGAIGIRANGGSDIQAIKKVVNLPLIGIVKKEYGDSNVYITPTIKEVREVYQAGAEIVAIDATDRKRPNGESLETLVLAIKEAFPNLILMADISTFEEGQEAERLGFHLISTTLCGYTAQTKDRKLPDLSLVKQLVASLNVPVIAEGGIGTSEEMKAALDSGAYAVVVGTAITRPREITKKFVNAL